jgi:hypothetical protein
MLALMVVTSSNRSAIVLPSSGGVVVLRDTYLTMYFVVRLADGKTKREGKMHVHAKTLHVQLQCPVVLLRERRNQTRELHLYISNLVCISIL